ncbi:MAG: ubiquinone/menaquinone biosynthesis methyltransferase [Candidatus Thorarchaeota archaeon]|nr:ubiquinone/menaquinone biosynthesis methyltransferase [Candidatus Thorarchaeota archaeon]
MSKGLLKIFSEVANQYELVNHTLTFGLDIPWRKRASQIATADGGTLWLEVCSGTGEMAVNLQKYASPSTRIVLSDFSFPMVSKARIKSELQKTSISLAESSRLPFLDNTFDLIVISFATRNITGNRVRLMRFFKEFHRVLKPEGRFINLETSQPKCIPIRAAYHLYTKRIVRTLGRLISGSRTGYAYLAHSVEGFFGAEELSVILHEAGFSKVSYRTMNFGIVAIHKAVK